jgi:hypothetical protein
MAVLSAVFKVAVKELGWVAKNPVVNVTRFAEGKRRERFLTEKERDRLFERCDASTCAALLPLVKLALATGAQGRATFTAKGQCRPRSSRSPLHGHQERPSANSAARCLSGRYVESVACNRLPVGPVFPVNIETIDQSWQEARAGAGLSRVTDKSELALPHGFSLPREAKAYNRNESKITALEGNE